MANIFDYMNWRDISFKKVEFNEIDNLILARLSYFPLDGLIKEKEEITLKEVYQRYQKNGSIGRILQEEDIDLFPLLANSIRFGNSIISNYVNVIDPNNEKQFSAVTILLEDGRIYVSYRGTDNTIIGWKEDFNMSFSELVPAQIDAKDYLDQIGKKYLKKEIRVGGHSKGGNLAIYAAAFCDPTVQKRIIQVYNNDGPGFNEAIVRKTGYQNILNRVHTYIPQTSIIGRLLNHEEKTTIVKSDEIGLMQHSVYSWQVLGPEFIKDELTNSSEFVDQTITNWLEEVSPEQREKFIDTLFEILNTTQANTLSEIKSKVFTNGKIMVKAYQNLDPETKKIVTKTLEELLKIGKSNIHISKLKRPIHK